MSKRTSEVEELLEKATKYLIDNGCIGWEDEPADNFGCLSYDLSRDRCAHGGYEVRNLEERETVPRGPDYDLVKDGRFCDDDDDDDEVQERQCLPTGGEETVQDPSASKTNKATASEPKIETGTKPSEATD